MSVRKWLGLDKLATFNRIIKQNGGIMKSIGVLYRTDDLKVGTSVGKDKFGNEYFENNDYYVPRNRWVIYSKSVYLDYDGSQVPPEWHRWLHHTTDQPPSTHPLHEPHWALPHEPNQSGYEKQYYPYSTMRTKTQAWDPTAPKKPMETRHE